MPKASKSGKSSASSGTRKKQAAKAAARKDPSAAQAPSTPAQRGQKKKDKGKKKEIKKKVFVPPPKPPQGLPDPLDTLGLASQLPGDLVVLLRKAGKKDVVTRQRALEGLLAWVGHAVQSAEEQQEENAAEKEAALTLMLPCWTHLFGRLAIAPTRRLRLLTAQIHKTLITSLVTRSEVLESPQYVEALLGPWALMAWDTEAQVARISRETWLDSTTWSSAAAASASEESGPEQPKRIQIDLGEQEPTLLAHLSRAITSPLFILQSQSDPASVARGTQAEATQEELRDAKYRDENVEETVESTQARLVAAGLGALAWAFSSNPKLGVEEGEMTEEGGSGLAEELDYLIHSDGLWNSFSPPPTASSMTSTPPLPEQDEANVSPKSLSASNPAIRARAWELLSSLCKHRRPLVEILLDPNEERAQAVLLAAWNERAAMAQTPMIDAVAPLLIAFPELWNAGEEEEGDDDGDDDEDGEVDEGDDDKDAEEEGDAAKTAQGIHKRSSKIIESFFAWLRAACGTSPALGYPAVIVLVSSLPSRMLTGNDSILNDLFTSLYEGLRSRSLDSNPMGARAFLASYCETLVFCSKAAHDVRALLQRHFVEPIWNQIVQHGALLSAQVDRVLMTRIQAFSDAKIVAEVAKTLNSIDRLTDGSMILGEMTANLFEPIKAVASGDAKPGPELSKAVSRAIRAVATVPQLLRSLSEVAKSARSTLENRQGVAESKAAAVEVLATILREAPLEALRAEQVSTDLASIASGSLSAAVLDGSIGAELSARFLGGYLSVCADRAQRVEIWHQVIAVVTKLPSLEEQASVLVALSSASDEITSIGESQQSMDAIAVSLVTRVCESIKSSEIVFQASKQLLANPDAFIDTATHEEIVTLVVSKIEYDGRSVVSKLFQPEEVGGAIEQGNDLETIIDLLQRSMQESKDDRIDKLCLTEALQGFVPVVFNLGYLSRRIDHTNPTLRVKCQSMWSRFEAGPHAQNLVLASLQEHILETLVPVEDIVDATSHLVGKPLGFVVSDESTLSHLMLNSFRNDATCLELSILDPLQPQTEDSEAASDQPIICDSLGYSSYTRAALALLHGGLSGSEFLHQRPWLLHHLVLVAIASEDVLNAPGSHTKLFSPETDEAVLRKLVTDIGSFLTRVISNDLSADPNTWHRETLKGLSTPNSAIEHSPIAVCLQNLVVLQDGPMSAIAARAFSRILSGTLRLSSSDTEAGDSWLKWAHSMLTSKPNPYPYLSAAIAAAARSETEGSERYSFLCNWAASALSGIPPSRISTEGVTTLRFMAAIAPSADSDTTFVPQQRAINALRQVQQWIASDEDISEEINTRLAELGTVLLPIVQDVPGSHLDFFMDLIESNLEVSSLNESVTLPCLFHTLRLLTTFRDLALRNANVRSIWQERKKESLECIVGHYLSIADASEGRSTARDMCIDLLLNIGSDLQSSRFDDPDSLHSLERMLLSKSSDVQTAAYRRLAEVSREKVAELVVSMALDGSSETSVAPKLPLNVLATISHNAPVDLLFDSKPSAYRMHGYFLSWLVVFEHFEGASMQLSSRYVEDLQKRGLVVTNLLPSIFAICSESAVASALDGALWSIEEIYLSYLDIDNAVALQVLAAHVYFRALIRIPTLVRNWWHDLRDKQLSAQVERFTTKLCSPVIAARELKHLSEGDAMSQLQDESMTVKVLATSEIVATYTVDEHPMEIGIKIPNNFPLQGVEIKDIKRVGVSEAQWRAWILAVQQLITSRNGLILDALMLFKKNAEAKFAGYEGAECAICYSIISPTDQSLPKVPCKTCKNRFHGQCLYKWVSTSGSSTCPLCRSIL